MSDISFIFRTDVHVADKGPASWKADYPSEIWSSLEQIGELAREYDALAVLDGGDFFHVKSPSRNSHASMYQITSIHNKYPCPTLCVEGNHDLVYNNLDSLGRQPLGVLYATGVFGHLRDETFEKDGLTVRVVGVPYNPHRTLDELLAIRKGSEDHLVAVVHALAGENPPASVEDFFGEPVFKYADLATEGGPDVYCFGHWHKDQGIVTIKGKSFVNQGSVSRGALKHENITRTPQVALLEFNAEGFKCSTLPLKVAPAEEVFDFETKERIESEKRSIDQFVEKLQADMDFDAESSIESNISKMEFARDIRELAEHYLELARKGVS